MNNCIRSSHFLVAVIQPVEDMITKQGVLTIPYILHHPPCLVVSFCISLGDQEKKMSLEAISSSMGGPLTNLLASGGGWKGVLGLVATAAAVLVPVTQVKPTYGVTLGYGAAMAAMGVALRIVHPHAQLQSSSSHLANALTAALIFYGGRLSLFLWLRQACEWRPAAAAHQMSDMPRGKRISFAVSLSLFYACLATPVLFVVASSKQAPQDGTSTSITTTTPMNPLESLGLALAWGGAVVEAVADGHKSWVKSAARRSGQKEGEFVGPTGGLYAMVRHPNYLGEVAFYTGLTTAAIPSLGKSVTGWICSTLGWVGITSLMSGSTRRLVEKQEKTYGGQAKFETWKKKVPYPWIPFVKASKKTTK